MIIKRLEKSDLEAINEIRNDNLHYIRQQYPQSMKQQEEWFGTTTDVYWGIFNDDLTDFDYYVLIGSIGLTLIDYQNSKVELSLITKDYINYEYASYALKKTMKYVFEDLNINKFFCTQYPWDDKKPKLLEDFGWKKVCTIPEDVYYKGKYHDHDYWCITRDEYYKLRK